MTYVGCIGTSCKAESMMDQITALRAKVAESEGYIEAFYAVARALDIGARPESPSTVFANEILPLVKSLRARVAELEADARRYQWLREAERPEGEIFIGVDSHRYPGLWALTRETADRAIDAAMGKP